MWMGVHVWVWVGARVGGCGCACVGVHVWVWVRVCARVYICRFLCVSVNYFNYPLSIIIQVNEDI